jgi:adenylate kinase family enzyme
MWCCGEMLHLEVEAQTPLGKEVADIMARGDLVSSAVVTALMRRRMRHLASSSWTTDTVGWIPEELGECKGLCRALWPTGAGIAFGL